MTLTEFLLARIAEDELRARQAGADQWRHGGSDACEGFDPEYFAGVITAGGGKAVARSPIDGDNDWVFGTGAHIAQQNPSRTLAECEAKRRIVNELRGRVSGLADDGARFMLRTLAFVYVDHPDFRDEWAA